MVDALHRIRAALEPGGVLIDTQPVSAEPPVMAAGALLGRLDMREWAETIAAVEAEILETIEAGLYSIEHEQALVVTDSWDAGPECLETVTGWQGTRLPDGLAARIASAPAPVTLELEVRLRLRRAR